MAVNTPADIDELTKTATILYGHIEEQIRFADTKAQLTVATDAVLAGVLVTLNTALIGSLHGNGESLLPSQPNRAVVIGIALVSALILGSLAGSFTFALLAVKPYRRTNDESWMYFRKIAGQPTKQSFIDAFLGLSTGDIIHSLLEEDYETACIAASKFARVGWSVRFLIVAVVAFVGGIIAWLLLLALTIPPP